jgi:pilus assembly protein CpaE
MTLAILRTASEELGRRLRPLTRATAPPVPGQAGDATYPATGPGASTVVILDCRPEAEPMLALAGELRREDPRLGVLLVSDRPAELGLAAMRAGVHDILSPDAPLEDFSAAVDRAAQAVGSLTARDADADRTQPDTVRTSGRVISVVSPKGGVGKTTVATNLAVGLAQRVPNSTVLVDLDVQFGDVASALDLEPEHFLADAVHATAKRDSMVLKTFLTQHQSGLYVICAPSSPAEADAISADDVSQLLRMLAAEFRYVVLDTAPGLSDTTLAALDETSDLVMLTSMDVPGVRGLRKELDALAQIGQQFESRQIVMNLVDARGLLSVADVEDTIGIGVDLLLPRSKAVLTSVNQGVPLLQSGRRDAMTKQLRRLVDRVTTGDPAVRPTHDKPGRVARAASQPAGSEPHRTDIRRRPTRKVLAS